MPASTVPDSLLLIAPDCPHCPQVLEALGTLIKNGRIGRLEVVNIASHPERAAELGVRSVPWCRIGPFVLEGLRSAAELAAWSARVGSPDGVREYVSARLRSGALAQVEELVADNPGWLEMLLPLVADEATELHVRIGLSAVMEAFSGTQTLRDLLTPLALLAAHPAPRVRSDACHFLALTGSPEALGALGGCLDDPDAQVREIAEEGIEALRRDGAE